MRMTVPYSPPQAAQSLIPVFGMMLMQMPWAVAPFLLPWDLPLPFSTERVEPMVWESQINGNYWLPS